MNGYEAQLGDLHQLITFDGETLTLPSEQIVFNVWGNYGAPPTQFVTRRGYKQHGSTLIDYFIDPKSVSVGLYRAGACTRIEYWQYRDQIHDLLRPNRGGPITLVLRRSDGQKRALKVVANPGAVFAPQPPEENSWNLEETIDFLAFDPFWFDPDAVNQVVTASVDSDLVFSIDFPIQFGLNGTQFNYAVTYTGTWVEYPTFVLTGPYTSAEIENLATGIIIYLGQGCNVGDTRTITLTPGMQGIVDSAGNSKFADLAPGSNLVDFNLRPDPLVANGIQTIRAVLRGGSGASGFRVIYNRRFFAV